MDDPECCACLGCPTCEHDCGLPPDVAQENHEHMRAATDYVVNGRLDTHLVRLCTQCGAMFDPRRSDTETCGGCQK